MKKLSGGKVSFLINPKAANSKWVRRHSLRNYFQKKLSGDIHDVYGDTRTTVERARAASADSDVIVAMGGDGTIADTLQGIFEAGKAHDVLFGVIPFGSGNAFRKSFGIPKSPRRAIHKLAKGVPRMIDLLEIDGRYAGFASVGATARVTAAKLDHSIAGFWGHVLAARHVFSCPRGDKEIELYDGMDQDGSFAHKKIRSDFLDCVIAKTNYFGYSWHIAPKARVDDGYLDVTLFEVNPLEYTLRLPLSYFGIHPRKHRHFKAKRVIVTGRDLPVQCNGEFLGSRERIEVRVVPQAIRVVCAPGKRGRKKFQQPA